MQGLVKGKLLFDEPLSKHTSFGVGGPADYWVEPKDLEDLKEILQFTRESQVPWKVLGRGTNVLVKDGGFRGIIINLCGDFFRKLKFDGEKVSVGAGILLSRLTEESIRRNLQGLELALGIPCTVGGAIVMNVGGPEFSMGEIVNRVEILDSNGKISTLEREDIGFRYRGSNLSPQQIILKAELQFKEGNGEEIRNRADSFRKRKSKAQPLSKLSAGCIFKNPPGDVSAAKLIEITGMKGVSVGEAQVSTQHANFIINHGKAKAGDVINLMEEVRKAVNKKYNINLELEIEIIGLNT